MSEVNIPFTVAGSYAVVSLKVSHENVSEADLVATLRPKIDDLQEEVYRHTQHE